MKALKFFAVVIAAFAMLVACEERPEPGKNPGGNNLDTSGVETPDTPGVETPDTPQVEEKVAIDLAWGGDVTEVNGKTFEVGMANYEPLTYELIVPVFLKNETSSEKIFIVKEVRKYDVSKAIASLCVSGMCMPDQEMKAEKEWQTGTVKAGEEVEVALHLTPLVAEPMVFPVDFTFLDGTDEVTFTINYNYTPAQ